MTKKSSALLLLVTSLALIGLAVVLTSCFKIESEDPNPRAPIARADVPDAVLGNGLIDTVDGGAADDWLFKQTSYYPGTRDKLVVKTVFDNRKRYLWPRGHYVLYEFHRADGTLERSELVSPEAHLNASVSTKTWIREFDATGKTEIRSRFVREDGTIGATTDAIKNLHHEYRADGVTLRRVQEYIDGNYRNTYFRLDGKTAWWVTDYANPTRVKVFFDLDGKPYEKELTRRHLKDGYSAGPDTKPFPYIEDTYLNAAGKREYVQTWYVVWDDVKETTRDVLHDVVIFAADGETVVKQVWMDISDPSGKFINRVVEHNADHSTLTRTYRSPGSREREILTRADGVVGKETTFDKTDSYVENLDLRIIQGFDHSLYGTYDDDSHDK